MTTTPTPTTGAVSQQQQQQPVASLLYPHCRPRPTDCLVRSGQPDKSGDAERQTIVRRPYSSCVSRIKRRRRLRCSLPLDVAADGTTGRQQRADYHTADRQKLSSRVHVSEHGRCADAGGRPREGTEARQMPYTAASRRWSRRRTTASTAARISSGADIARTAKALAGGWRPGYGC